MRACDYYDDFETTKIIYGHFQARPILSLDTSATYLNNKCYIIPNTNYSDLALLSSNPCWFVFSSSTTRMRGGYFEATTQNMNVITLPEVSKNAQMNLTVLGKQCSESSSVIFEKIQSIQKRIPDLCPEGQNPKLSTERLA